MNVIDTILKGVKIIEPKIFGDSRGFFYESFQDERYREEADISLTFVQDNFSRSKFGVLRGLHYQLKNPQGKLVSVIRGAVFDVAVDISYGSPTFGKWFGVVLSDENHSQIYIPPGFAHGFCVLSAEADFHYKCTDYYDSNDEFGILWNDEDIGIEWPKQVLQAPPILSAKDKTNPKLADIPKKLIYKF